MALFLFGMLVGALPFSMARKRNKDLVAWIAIFACGYACYEFQALGLSLVASGFVMYLGMIPDPTKPTEPPKD